VAGGRFSPKALRDEDERTRRAPLHQRPAEESGQVAAELVLEPCASRPTFGADEPLDGGAMLEEAGCSTGISRESGGGDLHAACIGSDRPFGNPWRE
jgi:hypothetical protein